MMMCVSHGKDVVLSIHLRFPSLSLTLRLPPLTQKEKKMHDQTIIPLFLPVFDPEFMNKRKTASSPESSKTRKKSQRFEEQTSS
jgi:hypothetical protein